jgi:hypothetical protein
MENQNKGGCLGIVIFIIVLCAIIGGCQSLFHTHDDADSIASAHVAVPDYLKSPSTADFVGDDVVEEDDDGGYVVTGSVDCQNGFGATVRVDYTVYEDEDSNVTSVYVQDRY